MPAAPADALERGPWWKSFKDPVLDQLQSRVDVSNQNVALAVAAYAQRARWCASSAPRCSRRSRWTAAPRVRGASGNVATGSTGRVGNNYQLSIGGSWEPDVWGRLGRAVDSATAGEQASAADLASAKLSAQGELAANYFSLRQTDAQKALLESTLTGYQRALEITQNRYTAGIAAKTDVLQAQTQLANAQADNAGLVRQRGPA